VKLSGPDAARFCAAPDGRRRGALIYGPDPAQTAQRREALALAIAGPNAEEEMRLDRMTGSDVRSDPARLDAALRAQGFFPGPRVVIVTAATDGLSEIIAAALTDAAAPDAFLLVTADALGPRSTLRRIFEEARDAVSAPCYGDAPNAGDIDALLRGAGAGRGADADAMEALSDVARDIGGGPFARLVEIVALHAASHGGPVELADVTACANAEGLSEADAAADAALSGDLETLRRALARLRAQGVSAVEVCLATQRKLRQLHGLAIQETGAARAAIERLQPRQRRERVAAQLRSWSAARLERAARLMLETDAGLRGGSPAPPAALLERALLRIASETAR
jgi:DNA polymerase-3 subunit delta